MTKEEYMKKAIMEAKKCLVDDEVPVGCIIVQNDKIIARGRNRRELKQNALNHAEIEAINKACKKLGSWRLDDCELYVTLEPCTMCAGAILNARIKTVAFGAFDQKGGAFSSVCNMNEFSYMHKAEIEGGILENECSNLLKDFFKELRLKKKEEK